MSTTLLNADIELSKQMGDYWSSTTTGAGSTTTLVDTALKAKANDWVTDETWAFLIEEPTGSAAIYDERKASSLDNSTGTLTTLAFAEAPGTGIDYEVHRLFSPSDKRRALIWSARNSFPHIHSVIRDETRVSHNWLKDGSFESWSDSSTLNYWTEATSTLTQTSTAYYFVHGSYSCKIDTAAGSLKQSVSNWDDLKKLAGHSVTFTIQAWCDTAFCLRIAIYDGTTTTYSDYHDGSDTWTKDNDPLSVTATIDENPSVIEFQILHESASGTSYVDDARVMGPYNPRVYIGDLSLALNKPHQILIEDNNYYDYEPWTLIHGIEYDSYNGYMYLPNSVPADRRLRILGIGYLDFLSSGSSSTAWTATINVDSPQLDILIANAILYLYTQLSLPNDTVGDRKSYQEMISFWQGKYREAVGKFGMSVPEVPVSWGIT